MDFIPDYDAAQKCIKYGGFSEYSRAYLVTNEDLRESMSFVPKNCNRALTVAASGDHPLFCSLYGAKHVDTFDISYNAKCVMDIKVAALDSVKYDTYKQLLNDLYWNKDIMTIKKIKKISTKLPAIEYNYLCSLKDQRPFSQGAEPAFYEEKFFTPKEYKNLRKIVKKPYDFIMTDIAKLSERLTEKYDFMHLSNILDYIPMFKHTNTILPLLEYVNVGGRILMLDESRLIHQQCYGFQHGPTTLYSCETITRIFKNWRFIKAENCINVLERTK